MTAAAPPRRRRLKPEQRRALIVDAAREEFGRRGHREARMEDIARRAGITKAVLYDHFPSKVALHAEVMRRANEDLVGATVAAASAGGEPRERFRAGSLAGYKVIVERPDVRMLLLGEPGADKRIARASVKAQRNARAAMAALYLSDPDFLRGDPRREERAQEVAQASIGVVNALAALAVERRLTPEQLTDLTMDVLWPGIDALRRS
jgi:AcrR family transcriptional regulator